MDCSGLRIHLLVKVVPYRKVVNDSLLRHIFRIIYCLGSGVPSKSVARGRSSHWLNIMARAAANEFVLVIGSDFFLL